MDSLSTLLCLPLRLGAEESTRPTALPTSRTVRYWKCVVLSHKVCANSLKQWQKRNLDFQLLHWACGVFLTQLLLLLQICFPLFGFWSPKSPDMWVGVSSRPALHTPLPTRLPSEALSHLPAVQGGTRFSQVCLFSLPGWASLSPTTGSSWPAPSCWSGTWSVVRGPSPRRWWAWESQRRARAPVTATCLPPLTTGPWLSAPLVKLPVSVSMYWASLCLGWGTGNSAPEGRVWSSRLGSCLAEPSSSPDHVLRGGEKSGGEELWITKSCPF